MSAAGDRELGGRIASLSATLWFALSLQGALLLESLATLNEAVADEDILTRGECGPIGWCTPELLRIGGKRRLQPGRKDQAAAEALLLRSLDVGRPVAASPLARVPDRFS
jgi:hypothetical protein